LIHTHTHTHTRVVPILQRLCTCSSRFDAFACPCGPHSAPLTAQSVPTRRCSKATRSAARTPQSRRGGGTPGRRSSRCRSAPSAARTCCPCSGPRTTPAAAASRDRQAACGREGRVCVCVCFETLADRTDCILLADRMDCILLRLWNHLAVEFRKSVWICF